MKKILAIFGCAFIGSALRYLLTPAGANHHLLTVLAINVTGSFLLPLITGALPLVVPVSLATITGLSVGLVGSFTTFSTFIVDALHLAQQGAWGTFSLYLSASLLLGGLAAALGIRLARKFVTRGWHQ